MMFSREAMSQILSAVRAGKQTLASACQAFFAELSAEELKRVLVHLNNDHREGVDFVFSEALTALESRVPSIEFVEFCDSL